MKKLLLIFLIQLVFTSMVNSQSFTVDDLLALTSFSSKSLDNQLKKNGFSASRNWMDEDLRKVSFYEKIMTASSDSLTGRSVDFYSKNGSRYFEFHTSSAVDFMDGQKRLVKAGFFYNNEKEIGVTDSVLYQRKNITVEATISKEDDFLQYNFRLTVKDYPGPASIRFADDLLKFDSHEYLAGFFGEKNVMKDFYFSDNELKKCTVLFGNSSRQAVFVWDDEAEMRNLSFVLISNIIPTLSAEKFNDVLGLNEWQLKNGLYSGMTIKELLRVNQMDFEIYGSQSERALMVKRENAGKIDFKQTNVTLSCNNCNENRLFRNPTVTALDIADENLPAYVYHIILFSPKN